MDSKLLGNGESNSNSFGRDNSVCYKDRCNTKFYARNRSYKKLERIIKVWKEYKVSILDIKKSYEKIFKMVDRNLKWEWKGRENYLILTF